jgi:hypothetical protein
MGLKLEYLEFSKSNFELLKEAYKELEVRYEERGMAMRNTGDIVRSTFLPYVRRIAAICREPGWNLDKASQDKMTRIQDALDELNKHTPI